jgi:HK97 family phage major capsid protein
MDRINELREARERLERLSNELGKLTARREAHPNDEGMEERISNLMRGVEAAKNTVLELHGALRQEEALRGAYENPRSREAGTYFGPDQQEVHQPRRTEAFRAAQGVLERHMTEGLLPTSDADRLDAVLRGTDLNQGVDAQYIAAVGQEEYRTAFAKLLKYGDGAMLRMTSEEQSAVQQVVAADEMRAMNTGVGSAGAFGVPLALDPTLIISSAGTVSPIRALASQVTISTREYKAVTTAGVTATFEAELTEVADGTPTLAQPDIYTEKAQAFVPFSIEIAGDYGGNLIEELGGLFADAKNILEGTKFALGAGHGSNEPQGLVNGLSGSSIYTTAASGTWTVTDAYGVQNSLSPRWQANAQWLLSLPAFSTTKRLVASASATEPQIVSPDGKLLLNKPWNETSDMASVVAAGNLLAIYGDISKAFRIVDRLGLSVELIPHIFGGSGRPQGERGLYAYWRTSPAVFVNDAARVVKIHA